jgi:hypothetical protein
MNLFRKIKNVLGLKSKYIVREIKENGKLKAAVLLTDGERNTLSKEERLERFRKWREEQG